MEPEHFSRKLKIAEEKLMAATKQAAKKKLRPKASATTGDGTGKKRQNRPGTVALRGIQKYPMSWNLLIPPAPFVRVVREISFHESPSITRWQVEALSALQEAAEDHIVMLFEKALWPAVRAKRVTSRSKDFELARRIGGKGQPW